MQKRWCVLLLLGLAQSVQASDIIGNGGDAVNCPSSVEMLDLYEGRTVRGLAFDPTLLGQDEQATVQNALNRLEAIDPFRVQKYREWADAFMSEARLVPDADLTDIPDSQHVAVPTGCTIEQVVIQTKPNFTEDPRYIISEKLWNRMDNANKASLILHEIVYREALSLNQKNSIASRYLNSLISSTRFQNLSNAEYLDALTRAKFYMAIALPNTFWEEKPVYVSTGGSRNYPGICGHPDLVILRIQYNETRFGLLIPGLKNFFTAWLPERDIYYLQVQEDLSPYKFLGVAVYANGEFDLSDGSSSGPLNRMALCVKVRN